MPQTGSHIDDLSGINRDATEVEMGAAGLAASVLPSQVVP